MSPLPPAQQKGARHAMLAAAILALVAVAAPAGAAPPPSTARAQTALTDPEGGSDALREQLTAASKGYLEAKVALARSTARQKQLTAHLATIEKEVAVHSDTVDDLAVAAYRMGRLGPVSALLNSDSPDGFLDRAATLEAVAANENRQLQDLMAARDRQARAKAAIDNEIRQQRRQLAVMDARKQQAERALAEAGGGASAGGTSSGSSSGSSGGTPTAVPAPRNSDGSWPDESCSVDDPTTSGCLTPRTLHALRQAQAAGFTRYVSCYRPGSSGEHPKGRACDFAAERDTFGGVATGGDKEYGDNLAAYFLRNADRLAVLYVIWYKRIWLPSSGWRSYSGGGDPASDHTNHVHLSVY
jgi:peptidoglycan DL-endopeptidase CwlO